MTAGASADEVRACAFYRDVLERLRAEGVRFLVGGAWALEHYTGISRRTKDIDLFVHPAELDAALRPLADAGFETEVTSPIWLGKARCGANFVDVIFSSGNGIAEVDDTWFAHAPQGQILGMRVDLVPPEEMIWSKAYVMERERFDGADVAHLIRACGPGMDWERILARFGPHWRVLLSHIVLFGFVYPGERTAVPEWVMRDLLARLEREVDDRPPACRLCQGTLLSRYQYRIDIRHWRYRDGRLRPTGRMTRPQAYALDRER